MKLDRKTLSQKIRDSKFNFISASKYVLAVSLAIIIAGIFIISFLGFNLGMDFAGGTVINVVVDNADDNAVYYEAKEKINGVLAENGLTASLFQYADGTYGDTITVRYKDKAGLSENEMETLNEDVVDSLFTKFDYDKENFDQKNFVTMSERIGASASSDLLLYSLLAILLSIIFMLAYIAIRFEFASGASAIIALIHDILIMCSLVLIFRIEVNSTFIAALITIIGYSINNTIVIFDRIRENSRNEVYKDKSRKFLADLSVKETLTRTVLTTITTLLTISLLAIFGETSIREFALPIIFGLISGFFSAVFVSPFFWTLGYTKHKKYNKKDDDNKEIKQDKNQEIVIEG